MSTVYVTKFEEISPDLICDFIVDYGCALLVACGRVKLGNSILNK